MKKEKRSLIILCTILISIILIVNLVFNFLHSYDNYKYKEELRNVIEAIPECNLECEIEESYVSVLPYSIEGSSIWKNKNSGDFIQIKDITYYNTPDKYIAYIYTSGDCIYIGDSETTVTRQLFTKDELLQNYVYVVSINDIGMRNNIS